VKVLRIIYHLEEHKEIVGRLIIFRDITARKENELHLLQLTQAVEQSPTSIVITDLNANIEYVNPHFTFLTGYTQSEALGKNTRILKSGQTAIEVYQEMWHTIQTGQTWFGEFLNKKKNGELYWERAVIAPVKDQEGFITNYIAVKEDITEKKMAAQQLQQAQELLLEQQRELAKVEERNRMARDLHDSVSQSIHGMVLFSETLAATIEKGNLERAGQIIERLQESARQSHKETRLLLYELQAEGPGRSVDLIKDLEERLAKVEEHTGVKTKIIQEGSLENIPLEWHENLFWITVEALNNALKHAQARSVQIIIRSSPQKIELEVSDDGRGFDYAKVRIGGLGLENMQTRATIIGGKLKFESKSGQGTTMRFVAELNHVITTKEE